MVYSIQRNPAAVTAATASSKIRMSPEEGGIFLSARITRMATIATIPKSSHVVRSISRQSYLAWNDSPIRQNDQYQDCPSV